MFTKKWTFGIQGHRKMASEHIYVPLAELPKPSHSNQKLSLANDVSRVLLPINQHSESRMLVLLANIH